LIVPRMIHAPPGNLPLTFMMGSAAGEGDDDERPQHKVTIGSAFAVGVYPVTRGEFAAFINVTRYDVGKGAHVWTGKDWKFDESKSWHDPGFPQEDDHPVVCVNWDDAQAYVAWLRDRTGGKLYRLLTEAEWEFCCRAGTTTAYSTGNTISTKQANFKAKGTTSVSKFPPNPWGICDMQGNVWEWCEDNWHGSYKGKPPTDGSVWRGGSKSFGVLRGGSWGDIPDGLRSANRSRAQPGDRNNNIGFRVASTLCAGAGGTTVPPGGLQKRSGPFMMIMVGVRVAMDVRYLGRACPGRRMSSDRRRRFCHDRGCHRRRMAIVCVQLSRRRRCMATGGLKLRRHHPT
jgi:formylglycine-generating enzyme required for sulfatase activity